MMKVLLENWKRYITESEESNVSAGRIYDLVFDIKGEVYNRSIKAPKFFTETEAEKESEIVFNEMKAKGLINDFKTYQAFVEAFNKLTDPKETNNISLSDVEALFKYFHVSKKKLNDNEPFVFNPRVPNKPYKHQGYVIEDDFTERISLASKVIEAAEAVIAEDGDVYWVYAADIHSIADDNLDVVSLKVTLQNCKDNLDSEDNHYGREYDFGKFLMKHSKKPDLRKVVKKTRKEVGYTGKYHPEDTKDLINSPSELPTKLRKQWFACVPDAEDTNEFWSLENTKMYLLGSYTAYSDYLTLTDEGLRIIDSIKKNSPYNF